MTIEQFILDVETLGTCDRSIVLSAAFLHFDPLKDESYDELVDKTLYIKFNIKEQKEKGRIAERQTLEWWLKQPEFVRKLCFIPSKKDVTVIEGINKIKEYIKNFSSENDYFIWTRGTLDQRVMENLCKTFELEPIANYNMFMDVRTAIRLLKETADVYGYCKLPDKFKKLNLNAHNPIDDVIRDVLMLKYGI